MVINAEFVDAMEWILGDLFQFPEDSEGKIYRIPRRARVSKEKFIQIATPLLVFIDPFGYGGKS